MSNGTVDYKLGEIDQSLKNIDRRLDDVVKLLEKHDIRIENNEQELILVKSWQKTGSVVIGICLAVLSFVVYTTKDILLTIFIKK